MVSSLNSFIVMVFVSYLNENVTSFTSRELQILKLSTVLTIANTVVYFLHTFFMILQGISYYCSVVTVID